MCGVNVVADLLNSTWEILFKETIEQTRNINLNFLEYMAIKQCLTSFIRNAKKDRLDIGPYRPYMLNLAFSQKKNVKSYTEKQVNMVRSYWMKFHLNGIP